MPVAYRIIRGRLFRVVLRDDGRMCLVTPSGVIIGAHAPRAAMRKPTPLPTVDPVPRALLLACAWRVALWVGLPLLAWLRWGGRA